MEEAGTTKKQVAKQNKSNMFLHITVLVLSFPLFHVAFTAAFLPAAKTHRFNFIRF